jgi:malonyl-CoA O-methyltransferase
LPFADNSVDVVFSNLMLPWLDDPAAVASEVNRVLRPGGLFAFSSLGPDSFAALRHAWGDDELHVNEFADMHDLGDLMLGSGMRDPVLDVDRMTVTYRSAGALFEDLSLAGARNALRRRRPGLTGRDRFEAMQKALSGPDGIAIELELVYGHCFGGDTPGSSREVRVAPDTIPVRRNRP